MIDILASTYDWLKAFHIIAVVAWMAGMLYLPRLFVYHADATIGSELSETLKIMEVRLLRVIINPAMIAVWVFGLALSFAPQTDAWSEGWFHAKLALVLALSGVHGYLAKIRKDFAADRREQPTRFYRILNEVPTVFLIAIVILVVVKPF
jgi:putative membrane protein